MKLQRLEMRGGAIGRRAANAASERIIRRANLPPDVEITQTDGGLVIAANRLRRRIITDPALRNFAHE